MSRMKTEGPRDDSDDKFLRLDGITFYSVHLFYVPRGLLSVMVDGVCVHAGSGMGRSRVSFKWTY